MGSLQSQCYMKFPDFSYDTFPIDPLTPKNPKNLFLEAMNFVEEFNILI